MMRRNTILSIFGATILGITSETSAQSPDIGDPTFRGFKELSDRGCVLTADAVALFREKTEILEASIENNPQFGLIPMEQQAKVTQAHAQAYFDSVRWSRSGPYEQVCALGAEAFENVDVKMFMQWPKTGTLTISGDEKDAPIYIDGIERGKIKQTFVLSIGIHTWKTMHCEESLEIKAEDTLERTCTKK